MEEKVYKELKQIRSLLSELVGSSELPANKRFSKEAIAKAAKEFRKLSIERGEWLSIHDIDKVIKNAPWQSGKIIIDKFEFTNYFIRGKSYYFNRKDLVALNKELKKKDINLNEYSELLDDQAKFEKYVSNIKLSKGKRHLRIPASLKDINSKPYPHPPEELVRSEITKLLDEYEKFDLSEYISLYENRTYAMFKFDYTFDRYLEPKLKKYCKDWSFKFNYANDALKKILKQKTELKEIE